LKNLLALGLAVSGLFVGCGGWENEEGDVEVEAVESAGEALWSGTCSSSSDWQCSTGPKPYYHQFPSSYCAPIGSDYCVQLPLSYCNFEGDCPGQDPNAAGCYKLSDGFTCKSNACAYQYSRCSANSDCCSGRCAQYSWVTFCN
jgi:hypothetical protein